MRGLYIHIPFCKQICSYCDFPKMVAKEENHLKYLIALENELKAKVCLLDKIDTVYIGGGTPNLLNNQLLERLLKLLKPYLDSSLENTIECNPDLITDEQAKLFKKYHINRVSMGVETINPKLLAILGRKHTKNDVLNAINILNLNGIRNINLDFIFGLPFETIEDLNNDLDFYFSLKLPHASFYSLILEEKTIMSYKIERKEIELPDDDLVASMYDLINLRMKENEYIHYEISNYAKLGYESSHNLLYWTQGEYVGIGMGAAGYCNDFRYTNYKTLKNYIEHVEEDRIFISLDEKKKEYCLLGLRKLSGVSISGYFNQFHTKLFDDFDLKAHLDTGLLKINGDMLYIPEEKMFLSNIVFLEFV